MHFTLKDLADVLRRVRTSHFHSLLPESVKDKEDCDKRRCLAIIDSMTKDEREYPEGIHTDRARRIARGSGTEPKDVEEFVRQFLLARQIFDEMQQVPSRQIMDEIRKQAVWGDDNPHVWSTVPFERKIWPLK